jgi:hypothetical protein
MSGELHSEYGPRRAAYDIKKLRGKGRVQKIGASRTPIDHHYENLSAGMRSLFIELGAAA